MDFSISERAQQLRNRAREFVRRYVIPLEVLLSGSWKELEPALQQARATAKSLGLWVPDLGVPLEEFAVLSEAADVPERVAPHPLDEREWEHGAEHGLVERGVGGEIHHGGEVDVDREQRLAPLGVAGR